MALSTSPSSLADMAYINQLNASFAELLEESTQHALQSAQKARELSEQIGYTPGLARSLNHIGLGLVLLSRYEEAWQSLRESLGLAQQLEDLDIQATAHNTLGSVHAFMGNPSEALQHFGHALNLERLLGRQVQQSHLLNNIAALYRDLGECEGALEYQLESLRISTKLGDRSSQAASLAALGELHCLLGQPQQALEYTLGASQLDPTDPYIGAVIQAQLGEIYLQLGQLAEAEERLQQALPVMQELGEKAYEANIIRQLGLVLQQTGRSDEALRYLGYVSQMANQVNKTMN